MMMMTTMKMQGGFRLELMVHDAARNLSRIYNLTSPAGGYVGTSNITYVRKMLRPGVLASRSSTCCYCMAANHLRCYLHCKWLRLAPSGERLTYEMPLSNQVTVYFDLDLWPLDIRLPPFVIYAAGIEYHSLLRKLHSRNIFLICIFFFSDFSCVIPMRYMCLIGSYQCRLFCLGILWNWYIA